MSEEPEEQEPDSLETEGRHRQDDLLSGAVEELERRLAILHAAVSRHWQRDGQ